jgi:hypothetical protein
MTRCGPGTIGRALFAYSVLGLALARGIANYLVVDIATGGVTYRVGDWVINYAGGFVRRGLFGALLFALSPPGQPTLWALATFQSACHAVVLAYLASFLHRTGYAWSAIALGCGPAALPFMGWDILAGWRKEIIVLAAIALLGWARRSPDRRARLGLTASAVGLFALAVFSWEASVFAVPVLLFLLREPDGRLNLRGWPSLTILGLGAAGGVASLIARGDPQAVSAICESVVARGLNRALCPGAVAMLGQPLDQAVHEVLVRFPLYQPYLWLLPLALLPVLTTPWLRHHWPWFVATALLVLPLYLVGQDYGRWAHVLVMAPALAVMAGEPADVASRWWRGGRTVAYVTLWGLPHWLPTDATWPLLGTLAALLDLSTRPIWSGP